jgi:hypothetical protein
VAYIAVMALVRLMVNHRETMMSKLRSQMAAQPRRKAAGPAVEERREAA